MAETFKLKVKEALRVGIRDDADVPMNSEVLSRSIGGRPSKYGYVRPKDITWPITDMTLASILDWPYPQIYVGSTKTLLLGKSAIYDVNRTTWAAGTALPLYNFGDPQTESLNSPDMGKFAYKWTLGTGFSIPAETLTNGTFTGSATKWTCGTGWAYGTSNVAASAGTASYLQQVVADQAVPLVVGRYYSVTFTVTASAGSCHVCMGTNAGTARSTSATFTETLQCLTNTTFSVYKDASFAGTVDTITVKEAVVLCAAGASGELKQYVADQVVPVVSGHLYRTRVRIRDWVAGTLTLTVGSSGAGDAMSQDGEFTQDIVCSGSTDVVLTPTSTFQGTIVGVSIMEIKAATIPAGTAPWQVADFGDSWFATNGASVVSSLYLYGHWTTYVWETESATYPIIFPAMCNFNQRLLMAGLSASTTYLSSNDWKELWERWLIHSPFDVNTNKTLVMGPNFVFFSFLSGGDYKNPFQVTASMFGLPNEDDVDLWKAIYLDWIDSRLCGFIQLPHGAVKCLKPLGNAVIAYSEYGVDAILPQNEEGLALYKIVKIADVGVASTGSVGGDNHFHGYIDSENVAWTIDESLVALRRGYAESLADLTTADLVVCMDPSLKEVYFSDGTYGAIMTPPDPLFNPPFRGGFGNTKVFPTCLLNKPGYGLSGAYSPSAGSDGTFEIITGDIDLEVRTVKSILEMAQGSTDIDSFSVYIGYKNSGDPTFSWLGPYSLNDVGLAWPIVAAVVFQLKFTGTFGTQGRFVYANATFGQGGKLSVGQQAGKR